MNYETNQRTNQLDSRQIFKIKILLVIIDRLNVELKKNE